jgi:hypothetical protein
MFSQLSKNDRLALVAAILVEITSLLALGDAWGMVMVIPFLASVGAIAVILLPWLAPSRRLPAPKGISLLALGIAAVVGTGISAAQNARFITEEIADPETLIFLGGLVVAVVLAYAGWMAFRGEQPAVAAAPAAGPAPAAEAAGAGEPPAS